jgi:hypothetical protein
MPAHIYARVGRWHDAVIANQRAIEADDAYLAACRGNNAQGRVSARLRAAQPPLPVVRREHGGRSATARGAALETAERTNLPELMRQPGFAGLQHYWMTPWFDRVRFGRWDEIARCPTRRRTCPTSPRSGTTRRRWPRCARKRLTSSATSPRCAARRRSRCRCS